MKPTHSSKGSMFSRSASSLAMALMMAVTTGVQAQSLISSADFFNPDFEARRPGTPGTIALEVNATFYNPGAQTAGNVTWSHSAGGLVQAGLELLTIPVADVQLAAYTRTQGNSLVFGRELEVSLLGSPSASALNSLVGSVTGASAVNSWNSQATVSNLSLSEGVLYSVNFDVTSGAGLNLAALSYAEFTLLNGGVPIQSINSTETLNLLNLLTIGSGSTSVNFEFYAPAGGLNNLSFEFDAATVLNVNLLGSITDNQTVMEISNFSVAPVPEPGGLALISSLGMMILLRRRRLGRA